MAKKTKKTKRAGKRATKKGAKKGEGTKFSLVAMHNELAKVIQRLKKVKSPKAYALLDTVEAFQRDTDCGQDMLPEL